MDLDNVHMRSLRTSYEFHSSSNAELLSDLWRSRYELCSTLFCIKKTRNNWNLVFSTALHTLGVVALYSSTQLCFGMLVDTLITLAALGPI
jgi:hypothetical protein